MGKTKVIELTSEQRRPKIYKLALLKIGWSLSATDPIILMISLLYNVNLSIMQGETNQFV